VAIRGFVANLISLALTAAGLFSFEKRGAPTTISSKPSPFTSRHANEAPKYSPV